MDLTRKQFDILSTLATSDKELSQRQLEEKTGFSLGSINKISKELIEKGLIKDRSITKAGIATLEPYRAKRAIFLAAGFGSRMVPITLNTPKPLVRVKGKRIIDGLIDACLNVGIDDIILVRGYLGEQFDQLLYKYPMIHFIENPMYNGANNISSAMVARYMLENAYVFESDFLINNPSIISKYHYTSNFLGIKMDRSDDWCFETKNRIITGQKVGGLNVYQQVGISYWNESDGKRLASQIKEAYESPGGKELYWEQTVFRIFPKDYNIAIKECNQEDIVEIDTFNELKAIDRTYDL